MFVGVILGAVGQTLLLYQQVAPPPGDHPARGALNVAVGLLLTLGIWD